jgi:hypothetical protein
MCSEIYTGIHQFSPNWLEVNSVPGRVVGELEDMQVTVIIRVFRFGRFEGPWVLDFVGYSWRYCRRSGDGYLAGLPVGMTINA